MGCAGGCGRSCRTLCRTRLSLGSGVAAEVRSAPTNALFAAATSCHQEFGRTTPPPKIDSQSGQKNPDPARHPRTLWTCRHCQRCH